jgi:hypothetical protein
MSDYLKKRWIIVGIVWMATFSLTYWNFYKIESIENAREKKEIYLMDEQFWSNNASTISQILKKRASLIQEVESSKLGVFEFQNNLRSLSLKLGLNAIKLISQPEFDQDGIVPVRISFQSNFKQAMQWIDLLKIDLPYAQIRNVKIIMDKPGKQTKFVVSIHYRYTLYPEETSI